MRWKILVKQNPANVEALKCLYKLELKTYLGKGKT